MWIIKPPNESINISPIDWFSISLAEIVAQTYLSWPSILIAHDELYWKKKKKLVDHIVS